MSTGSLPLRFLAPSPSSISVFALYPTWEPVHRLLEISTWSHDLYGRFLPCGHNSFDSYLIFWNRLKHLKDPSHPLCFARLEDDMRHFRCHRNSSFLQCEFKSFYILPNIAYSGLNSPSTRSQTFSGFI